MPQPFSPWCARQATHNKTVGVATAITQRKKLTWRTAAEVLVKAIYDTGSQPTARQVRTRTQPRGEKTPVGAAISERVKALGVDVLKKK